MDDSPNEVTLFSAVYNGLWVRDEPNKPISKWVWTEGVCSQLRSVYPINDQTRFWMIGKHPDAWPDELSDTRMDIWEWKSNGYRFWLAVGYVPKLKLLYVLTSELLEWMENHPKRLRGGPAEDFRMIHRN